MHFDMFRLRYVCVLLALLLAGVLVPRAAAQGIKASDVVAFEARVSAGDPFDPANRANAPVKVRVRRGETVRVEVKGIPKSGYHTYPITKATPTQPAGQLSRLSLGTVKGVAALNPIRESEPKLVQVLGLQPDTAYEYDEAFAFSQDVVVLPDAVPGAVQLPVEVQFVACNELGCLPPDKVVLKTEFDVTSDEPVSLTADLVKRMVDQRSAPPPSPLTSTPGPPPTPGPKEEAIAGTVVGPITASQDAYKQQLASIREQIVSRDVLDDAEAKTSLLAFLLAGVFWGGVSLITPCVFPMIPITVSFFLKQSEKEHHRPISMATVYCLTIVVVLTVAATFLLAVFRWLSINPILNYGLGGLFVLFALSLFGMYEIELPSGLARFTSAREGKGGHLGTMFMALTFTIISFACVAPFLGGFGGTAAAERPLWQNLLGGLAFSVTFAAPFFVLALFPSLLKQLPKSGSWLNSVKVVMGFLELAAAFKFFRAAELVQTGGEVTLFSFDLVLSLWIGLSILCGLYLIGVFNLPHDTPGESIGVPRMLFSAAFIGMGLYLLPALFKINVDGPNQRPTGAVYAWVDSFLLPDAHGGGIQLPRTGNLEYAVAEAREYRKRTGQPKRLFLDFTGFS